MRPAKIPAVTYNLTVLGYQRSRTVRGRGGARYSAWRLGDPGARAGQSTRAGKVDASVYWDRISYFLERIVPVANQHRVRIACHPHDPPTPPGFRGVDAVLGTVEGLKKFVAIAESPYHGLNFCQGTMAEMLADPGREIFEIIRYFGQRKKIFNVHFRNIRGRRDDFEERAPDDGDIDFARAVAVYRDVGYEHMLMPDHVGKDDDDPDERQALAFSYGYIRGLIHGLGAPARFARWFTAPAWPESAAAFPRRRRSDPAAPSVRTWRHSCSPRSSSPSSSAAQVVIGPEAYGPPCSSSQRRICAARPGTSSSARVWPIRQSLSRPWVRSRYSNPCKVMAPPRIR